MKILGRYIINGGKRLFGTVNVHGSKNAALPILCACIVNSGINIIHNCPKITDVYNTCRLLEKAGCSVLWEESTVVVDSSKAHFIVLDGDEVSKMRSSVIFVGAFCGRFKRARVAKPGGCKIGKRPLDIHFDSLEKLGIDVIDNGDYIDCVCSEIVGTELNLRLPSVGATENIMLAAVSATGKTVIKNAAMEPEIQALADFLKCIGAYIDFCSDGIITIEGVNEFKNSEYTIIPDRIEAGTFLAACAATKGEIFLKNAAPEHMKGILTIFDDMGGKIESHKDGIHCNFMNGVIYPQKIKTGAYPAFPTDMQPQIMAVLTLSVGESIIIESVFENRFGHVPELCKMGADISCFGRKAVINGVPYLEAAEVSASDLRAGAGLIIAALSCGGTSFVYGTEYIMRGYENIEKSLSALGADIRYEN